ncbi:hypothetical protein FRC08_004609 [Ceratobasidium sp. 394]|nr:hypothetical protein FRC08_004609 [Ceratobasidium sp. 394]KAG9098238.1 hypothetical protein FS749_004310 [Ceratobasidium sp. UAMH 11750]
MAILAGLGECFLDRYRRSHSATDVSESAAYFEQAARSQVGDPRDRAGAASQWAVASLKCQPQSSLEAYQYFMSLIPQVVWLGLAAQARYERIADVSKLTLEAATVAIHFQKYEQALEWLDQGRSIVWSQLLQLRQPLDELQNVDPALSEELVLIANELQSATALETFTMSGSEYQNPPEHAAQRHRRLTEKWEELVYRAQSLPGMGDFLAPKKVYQLVVAARTRALVVVIVHEAACNALVIRPGTTDVGCVLLKDLTLEKIAHASNKAYSQNAGRVRTDRKITNAKVDREPSSVLSFLWTSIAKPVLDYLEYTEVLPMEELPHITWCTTGPLSFLPLHAAGDYSKPHCSLSDYAISSYTPTLGTLLARSQESVAFSGLATIGQALTPGFPTLPGTVDELNNISKQAERIQVTRLDGDSATGEAVLDVMERHSWVHLACHASQDLANPTASAFHLHDGPLDLASITRNNLKHADFAFLSACQTATGDKHLSEEAVHLAAGMIMAGYRAVVATLWPIDDRDAPLVADRFYEYMLKDGEPDTKKVARALHYAVGCLRDSVGVEAYWRWAPYIHIGQ